jgi:hypothetical protein
MPKKKKPPTQPPTQVEPPQVEQQIPTMPTPQLEMPQLEIRKISHEEYLEYGNEKKESEYAKIARTIVEKAMESDAPLLIKLPQGISARRVVPILARIVSELWKNGTRVEFKASYNKNEIVIRARRQ